jgi:kumamolisin
VTINAEKLAAADRNDPDSIGECMLDVEVVAGVCPKATLAVYFSNFTEKGWVDVLDAALHDKTNAPSVLSCSYGLAEGTDIWTEQAMTVINDTLKEAAALGIPVCVAAGDDGSDDQVGDGQAHVDFPSSSPYVLCVGGTALKKNGVGFTESAWFDGNGLRKDGGGSTGGGVSSVLPRPSWQNLNIASVNPNAPAGRCVPDVAADAAGSTGYLMVSQGKAAVSGGTSAAAPLWAALIARLNEAGKPVKYVTPLFYQSNPKTGGKPLGAAACNDVTKGNNKTAAAGGYECGQGYDAVTGWGSPNGQNLLGMLP